MSILDRHIRKTIFSATLVVFLALLGVQSFMELVSQFSDIGKGTYTVWSVLLTVPLRLPADLYVFFPVAGFLGCLLGMGRLASSSELIIMRASGVSIAQISWSVIKTAIILVFFMTLAGEWLAPNLQNKADKIQQSAMGFNNDNLQNLWLHQGNRFIHITSIHSAQQMQNLSIFEFSKTGKLISATSAPEAIKKHNTWYLVDSEKTRFLSNKVEVSRSRFSVLPIVLDAQLLFSSSDNIQADSIVSLIKNIGLREHSGLLASQFQLSLWQRIFQPFTTLIMIALGIPFIFGSLRSASMSHRMLVGIIIGFAFYMINRLFGPFTIVYQFPPLLAALLPAMLFLFLYGILIYRLR